MSGRYRIAKCAACNGVYAARYAYVYGPDGTVTRGQLDLTCPWCGASNGGVNGAQRSVA